DKLWVKAVKLASENQNLIPGNVHMQIKEFNTKGKVKGTEASWLQFVETDNGRIETKLVKKLKDGEDVTDLEKEEKGNRKNLEYNSDLSDCTLPFNPKIQPNLTVKRSDQIETKAGQVCVVYVFKCTNPKNEIVVGKAWLNLNGVPVAMSYGYDPLPKRLPKQLKEAAHEVYYQYDNDGKWYPERVFIKLKSRLLIFRRLTYIESTFSDYWIPKVLRLITNGKPHIEEHKVYAFPFEYINGYLFVKVKINDLEHEYRFLLDTGASITVVNPRIAAALCFKKTAEMEVRDGFISKKADVVRIEELNLGEITVENCGAVIFDMGKIEADLALKIDGIIGSNFLSLFVVRIDYSKKELVFTANSDGIDDEIEKGHRIPLVKETTGLVFAPLTIAGVESPFKAEIDTGATASLLIPMHYLEEFKPVLNSKIVRCLGVLSGGAFGESDGSISRIGQFKLGELSIENMVVKFENRKNDFVILGNDFLSRFIVIINYPKNEMLLLPLEGQTLETNVSNFGFYTKQNETGQIKITGLYEGLTAEQAGLRVGDAILRVVAGDESGRTYEEFIKIIGKYNTIQLYVQRDGGEEEIVLTKSWLFPEVDREN
ncbi:MAG: aspartyl protease family protein, partial [Bacteroidota bacterium]